jgi:hypothetical protein
LSYDRQFEAASRETVQAELTSIRQHLEDSVKVLKAELGGQIELMRKDINDLQADRQQQKENRRDTRRIVTTVLSYIGASAAGALIAWWLTSKGG